jgi:hypothetical protein
MRSEAAKEIARKRDAPSAIAVVDPAGGLLTFELMDREGTNCGAGQSAAAVGSAAMSNAHD